MRRRNLVASVSAHALIEELASEFQGRRWWPSEVFGTPELLRLRQRIDALYGLIRSVDVAGTVHEPIYDRLRNEMKIAHERMIQAYRRDQHGFLEQLFEIFDLAKEFVERLWLDHRLGYLDEGTN